MKKYFILSLATLFFVSCQNSKSEMVYADKDVVTEENSNTSVKSDPYSSAQAKIAFGDIEFGMSKQQYNELRPTDLYFPIGNHEYKMEAYYEDEDLGENIYMLEIYGRHELATKLRFDIKNSVDNLVEVVTNKYGQAHQTFDWPKVNDFTQGYIIYTHQWNIGTKTIQIGVMEAYSGGEYKAICRIVDQPTYDRLQKLNELEAKERAKIDADLF